MEPMTVGSAPSSPTSATIAGFLPPFLMGQNEASTPKQAFASTSRVLNRSQEYNLSSTDDASPIIRQRLFGPPMQDPLGSVPEQVTSTKAGPPRQSLFDTINVTKHSSPYVSNFDDSTLNYSSPAYSLNNTSQQFRNESMTNWVTIFGFTSNATALILSAFANCGTIIEKRVPPQGNWVNLRYSSKMEAQKALSLNGTLIANKVMVGVVPYVERPSEKENIDLSRTVYSSPVRVRSLKHSFVSPQSSNNVVPMHNVPQKSTGIVTKAMEYVFGW